MPSKANTWISNITIDLYQLSPQRYRWTCRTHIRHWINRPFSPTEETRSVGGLKGLLLAGWHPRLIHKVTKALIEETVSVCTSQTTLACGLVDSALTLHRISETMMCGLDFFERLMAIGTI